MGYDVASVLHLASANEESCRRLSGSLYPPLPLPPSLNYPSAPPPLPPNSFPPLEQHSRFPRRASITRRRLRWTATAASRFPRNLRCRHPTRRPRPCPRPNSLAPLDVIFGIPPKGPRLNAEFHLVL